MVRTTSATKRNLTNRVLPSAYACSQLAAELADEWVEYVEAAGLTAGTVQSYQQAISSLCASVDLQLGQAASGASLGRDQPDLARAVATWERTLPSGFPAGSMRPAILSGAIRVLVRRRAEHPERTVAARVTALAKAGSGVPAGEYEELDEFSWEEKQAMVRTAWTAVVALEKRLAAGWERAGRGQHPQQGSWTGIDDLLWGLAHGEITPARISEVLPPPRFWPEQLRKCIRRPDGTMPHTARTVLTRWLVAQLWPTTMDLHAFRVLLVDATGHPPEEVSQLTEEGVEFTPGGVRLTLVRKRAKRRYYRAFKDVSLELADVIETKTFKDQPRREPGAIARRLMQVTERTRELAHEPDRKLFVRAVVDVDRELKFCEWNPEAPLVRFSTWLKAHGVTVEGKTDIRRLRKSTKVERVVTSGGHISEAANDHHEQTFKSHYAQGTTLRVISGEVINSAQEHWLKQAVEGPTVVTQSAVSEDSTQLQEIGLSKQEAADLIQGELDMGVTHCKNPYDSPYSPTGELCAVAPLRCLECRNAWVLPSQLPQLLLFSDHLERMRNRLSPPRFTAIWGQSYTNLQAVITDRSDEGIRLARKHIDDGGIALDLPLSAHVEFDG
ncbi:hypothetical protein CP975_00080 [Streptomyces alboniger]|uniref:Uncharacterized protein n=2 Tax=Streptomyces alboniger TaxID=132473 RepID=A0A5J6HCM6_STRAD|nr:hypothetical protein CP975_00080 [Streptomyces alboniger]